MTVRYYTDTQPELPLLLRRTEDSTGITDEAFRDGQWVRTPLIIAYMAGRNDWVEDVSESQARRLAPADAF